jgi:uncharacterized protein
MTISKFERLDRILYDLKSFVVAFSGGVDSSFLLHRAATLGLNEILGVTIRTPYIPAIEIDDAVKFTKTYGISHKIIDLPFPESVRENPPERCYLCKKTLFSELLSFAVKNGFSYVLDGSNADDAGEYRPGLKALTELSVRSPLMEAGLTKSDIREMSHKAGLPVWDKPAMACLLTRIPYNTTVNEMMIRRIEEAEVFLYKKGFPGVRVRVHGDLARIECPVSSFENLIHSPEREQITDYFKKIGFRYVSLDLEGYRTGSFNPEKSRL